MFFFLKQDSVEKSNFSTKKVVYIPTFYWRNELLINEK